MLAAVWHGRRNVQIDSVPDPVILEPTDAIVRVTSSGLCGSDLHLYEVLAPFMTPGDILGHEPMGIVEAVGSLGDEHRRRRPRRRAVQHLVRPLLHVRLRACSRSAKRHRFATQGAAQHCSDTPSSTARFREVRPNSSVCRTPTTGRSRSRTARATTGSCSCPTSSPRRGRPFSTPRPRRRERGRARPRPDRRHGMSGRPAPRRRQGDRHRSGSGAARAREVARRGCHRLGQLRQGHRARRRREIPHRGSRPRRRDRRRRHGSPRLPRGQSRPLDDCAAARAAWPPS